MKIVFNTDGSIKYKELGNYIQQGNDGVDKVLVAVEGRDNDSYTLSAIFELPNGEINTITSSNTEELVVDGTTYNGRELTLTQAQTLYAGELKMSLQLIDLNNNVLYTYRTSFTINRTPFIPDEQKISQAQWNNLLSMLNTYQVKYAVNNVRFYPTLTDATNDVTNLADGQIVFVKNENALLSVYVKTNGSLQETNFDDLVFALNQLQNKQDKLIAGHNIFIDENGVISASSGATIFEGPYNTFEDLPQASAETIGAIYLVNSGSQEEQNYFEEYITIQREGEYVWELLGTSKVDLSNYVQKTNIYNNLTFMRTFPSLTLNGASLSTYSAEFTEVVGGNSFFEIKRNGVSCNENDAKIWLRKTTGYSNLPLFDSENPRFVLVGFKATQDYGFVAKTNDLVILKFQWSEEYKLRGYIVSVMPFSSLGNLDNKVDKISSVDSQRHLQGREWLQCVGGGVIKSDNFVNLGGTLVKNPYISIYLVSGSNYKGFALGSGTDGSMILLQVNVNGVSNDTTIPSESVSNVRKLGDITAIPNTYDSANNNIFFGKNNAFVGTTRQNNIFIGSSTTSVGTESAAGNNDRITSIGGSVGSTVGCKYSVIVGHSTIGQGNNSALYSTVVGEGIPTLTGSANTVVGAMSNASYHGTAPLRRVETEGQALFGAYTGGDANYGVCIGAYSKNRIDKHISFDGKTDSGMVINRTLDLYGLENIGFRNANYKDNATATTNYSGYKTLKQYLDEVSGVSTYQVVKGTKISGDNFNAVSNGYSMTLTGSWVSTGSISVDETILSFSGGRLPLPTTANDKEIEFMAFVNGSPKTFALKNNDTSHIIEVIAKEDPINVGSKVAFTVSFVIEHI